MPFVSEPYIAAADHQKIEQLLSGHLPLGEHPETGDVLLLSENERYAGTHLSGLTGSGKSALLANMILHDAKAGRAVILIDPHGDLARSCIERLPAYAVVKTHLLDMEDEDYPFGVNGLGGHDVSTGLKLARAVDLCMHSFEAVWPDVLKQVHLPRYLRSAIIVLLANPGMTLVDMRYFLLDDRFRAQLLKNVTDYTVLDFWLTQYGELSDSERLKRVQPLLGRLELLFVGRSIVRNIVGQSKTSIDIAQSIWNKELNFFVLQTQSLTQDARLIGTMLMAQIHAAVFAFGDLPRDKRPEVSIYIDEVANFVTQDIAELFTQGRKFGVKLTVAHQYRGQLPEYLRQAILMASTKVCFQQVRDDAHEMAHLYNSKHAEVRPEDIDPHPVEYLLTYGSDDHDTQQFANIYLRSLQSHKRGGQVEVYRPVTAMRALSTPRTLLTTRVADPTVYLNNLLYEVMTTGNPHLRIPHQVVYGYSGYGHGFYNEFNRSLRKEWLLSSDIWFPSGLVVEAPDGTFYWTRVPENSAEQLWHFLFTLRMTMAYLAEHPIGKRTVLSTSEVAQMLTELPRRAAFVRTGEDVGVIYTSDLPPAVPEAVLEERLATIQGQTHEKYSTPKAEIEDRFLKSTQQDTNTSADAPIRRWEEI